MVYYIIYILTLFGWKKTIQTCATDINCKTKHKYYAARSVPKSNKPNVETKANIGSNRKYAPLKKTLLYVSSTGSADSAQ